MTSTRPWATWPAHTRGSGSSLRRVGCAPKSCSSLIRLKSTASASWMNGEDRGAPGSHGSSSGSASTGGRCRGAGSTCSGTKVVPAQPGVPGSRAHRWAPLVGLGCPRRTSGPGRCRICPGRSRPGSGPMTRRFAACHRGQLSATSASVASGPRSRRARSHRVSPRRTTTWSGSGRGTEVSRAGLASARATGRMGSQPGAGTSPDAEGDRGAEARAVASDEAARSACGVRLSPATEVSTVGLAAQATPGATAPTAATPSSAPARRRDTDGAQASATRAATTPHRPGHVGEQHRGGGERQPQDERQGRTRSHEDEDLVGRGARLSDHRPLMDGGAA